MAVLAVLDPLLSQPGGVDARSFPGHEVVELHSMAEQTCRRWLSQADVLLTATVPVTAGLLDAAPRLRLVAKPGAGLDNIDVEAATRRGVVVCHAPRTRGQAVAEHVVWGMLHLAKAVRVPGSEPVLPLDLAGRTLGLVGLGDIGSRVAAAAGALAMDVVASTASRRNPRPESPIRFVDLARIHRNVDVLVLCMPLTPETEHLVDRRRLEEMRGDAMLINVARGRCVVTDDLTQVLSRGHLHGVVLDVTDPEPLPEGHPLRRLPNAVITPHVAGRTSGAQRRAIAALVHDVNALLSDERPLHAVNWYATEGTR